jgi:hypothetical protein
MLCQEFCWSEPVRRKIIDKDRDARNSDQKQPSSARSFILLRAIWQIQLEVLVRVPDSLPSVDPITTAVAEVIGQWKEISANRAELEAFGRAMVSMAQDLGLSPAEVRALAAKREHASQLVFVLEAPQIDMPDVPEKRPAITGDLERPHTACV